MAISGPASWVGASFAQRFTIFKSWLIISYCGVYVGRRAGRLTRAGARCFGMANTAPDNPANGPGPRTAQTFPFPPAATVRALVAPAVAGAAGPFRDDRPAGLGVDVPGRDHRSVLVPAQRRNRPRHRRAAARHRSRPAADPAAPDRKPG